MSPEPRANPFPWAWLGLLWVLWGLACHPTKSDPSGLDAPPVPEATVVARLDPDGVAPWSQGPPLAEPTDPRIVDVGPEGDVGYRPSIFVRFDQPVTTPDGAAPLLRLEPEVPGEIEWPDAYQAVLRPLRSLESGRRYTVVAEGRVETSQGRSLEISRRWVLDVERPRVDLYVVDDHEYAYSYGPSDGRAPLTHWKAKMLVIVERETELAALRDVVEVESRPVDEPEAAPRSLPVRVRMATERELEPWGNGAGSRSFFMIEPEGHWPPGDRVTVRVGSELRAKGEELAVGQPKEARFDVRPGLSLQLRCGYEYDDGCDPGPLMIDLDQPVSRRQLSKIEVSPRPARLAVEGDDQYGLGITRIELDGRFLPDHGYTISVPKSFRDVHGQGLAEALSEEVRFVMPPPSLELSDTRGFLPAEGGTTVGIEARSVIRARLRVAVLDDEAAVARASMRVDEGSFPTEGAEVIERELDLDPQGRFEWSSLALDLTTFTKGRRRPVFVEVVPLELTAAAAERTMPRSVRGLFQVTDLGAFVLMSSSRSVARITTLSTGEPRPGAEVRLFRRSPALPAERVGAVGLSSSDGLAPMPSMGEHGLREAVMLVRDAATDDRFVMDLDWLETLIGPPAEGYRAGESVHTRIVTERPLYRPGETVHVVGWAAVSTPHTPSGLRPVPAKTRVTITLRDSDGEQVLRRTVRTKEYGKYWATLPLGDELRLGSYSVHAELVRAEAQVPIRLRRFRTPSFAVDAAIDRGDVLHGESPQVTASAKYFFGGQVPIAYARRRGTCYAQAFRPPGLSPAWVVGTSPEPSLGESGTYSRITPDPDHEGRVHYSIDVSGLEPSWSHHCTSSLAIQDAAAAEAGADVSFMVHPSRYLMVRTPQGRLEAGNAVSLPVRATTYTAERVASVPVTLEVEREYWAQDAKGRWEERTQTRKGCTVRTTAEGDDPVCRLRSLPRGFYTITARTTDDEPKAEVVLHLWVGDRSRPISRRPVDRLSVEISDPEPRPGDRVTVTVRSPEPTARGVLTLMHGGLRSLEPFVLVDGEHEHTFTVLDSWVPTVEIEAVVVHPATEDRRQLIEHGSVQARVTPEHRALRVEVRAPDVASPRQEIPIELMVHDAEGEPSAAHVALWAVDEAMLSLAEPVIPDLVEAFAIDRGAETNLHDDFAERLFPYVVRDDPYHFGWEGGLGLIGHGAGGGGMGRGLGGVAGGMSPKVRKNFDPTPIFLGDVAVGPTGKATVLGTLPDDLTTFRISAIASAKLEGGDAIGRFGHADTRTRVTAPLVAQPVLPRHMRPGDVAQASVLVDNLGGPSGTLTVIVEVEDPDGALRLTSSPTAAVRVEAGEQVRVPFGLEALEAEGEPTVTITAMLAADEGDVRLGDAAQLSVPVAREPGLRRRVAVYGSVDDDEPIAVALRRPEVARPGAGGLEVSLSSTLLGGAEDMVDGLVSYPYGCVEQTSSRLLPLAALGGLAEHYPLGVPDLDAFVAEGVQRLRSMQTSSGGLAYWPSGDTPHAYATAYATWVLVQLRDSGYSVPRRFLEGLREYLAREVDGWASHGTPELHDDVRLGMALVALARPGTPPADALVGLFERRDRLPLFTRAMVLLALHRHASADPRVATLATELLDDLDERDGFAHVRDGGGWLGSFFDSGPRTEAMVLLALLKAAPDDRRVQKLVRGLMELRRAGGVSNTQERAYALLALGEYARRFEATEPAFDTGVWVDAEYLGGQRFEGRSAEVQGLTAPLPWADEAKSRQGADPFDSRVTLRRQGEGRMVYRVAMEWEPAEAGRSSHAAGISIERVLRSETGPIAEGEAIARGQMVALDLTITNNEVLDYVAIDLPLPAGLEAVDTTIGRGRRAMVLRGSQGWWVSHTELHTERALVFADRLAPGTHQHTVFLRAITPGEFVMPPSRAEAMYYPEIRGNTAASTVVVR